MTITILKALIIIMILVLMIIVLVVINHYFAGGFVSKPEQIEHLREEVREGNDVVTDNSSFGTLEQARVQARSRTQENLPTHRTPPDAQ